MSLLSSSACHTFWFPINNFEEMHHFIQSLQKVSIIKYRPFYDLGLGLVGLGLVVRKPHKDRFSHVKAQFIYYDHVMLE